MPSPGIGKIATETSSRSGKVYATWEPGPEERNEMIRVAAYFIAERDGFKGNKAEYWAAAEYHVNQMLALRESQEKLQIIIDTALDAMVLMDARGIITGWSNHAESLFGLAKKQSGGRCTKRSSRPGITKIICAAWNGSWLPVKARS